MNFRAIAMALKGASYLDRYDVCRKYGMTLLDSGSYGAAYLHVKTQRVLKVSFSLSDGTMGFIAKCAEHFKKHGEAPLHCVRVYEFGKMRGFWYAVMERVRTHETIPHDFNSTEGFFEHVHNVICAWIGEDNLQPRFKLKYVADDMCDRNCGVSMDGTRMCVFDPWSSVVHVKKFPKSVVHARTYGPQRHQGARYAV